MSDFFTSNLSLIRGKNPGLCERLSAASGDEVKVAPSRAGEAVPEVSAGGQRFFLHSRYEPAREAERFIAEIDTGDFNLFIVFGFGFGYHIEALLRRADPAAHVLVLEKSSLLMRRAFESRDLSQLLADGRVSILLDPDEEAMSKALRGKSTYRVSLVMHRGSHRMDPGYYNNLRRVAKSYLSAKDVNIATLAKFERLWAANCARNIERIAELPGADIFYDRFKGVPAVVVAAGPSLTESIESLRAIAGRALIIAVDTSFLILRRHRIEPHLCVSVDPQLLNARYFEGADPCRTILVADPTVHPSAFRLFKGRAVTTGMAFPMMKWIDGIVGERGELAYGGSVSTNAYDLARRLGASPVALVGQDLAFTGGLAHARGSYLDELMFLRTTRFGNPLMTNRFQLTALPDIAVKGIRSPRVHTNQKMMIFVSWFEKRNDPNLINASYDGAYINGLRHLPLEGIAPAADAGDLFEALNRLYDAARKDADTLARSREGLRIACVRMLSENDSLLPSLERAAKLSGELRELMRSGSSDSGRIDYILKKLSEIDRSIEAKKGLKDMIGFTVQHVIHTITEEYEIDEGEGDLPERERIARRSEYLYRGLLEGCVFNGKVLRKMISFVEGEPR